MTRNISEKSNIYAHDIGKNPLHHWYTLVAGFSGDFIVQNLRKYNIKKGDTLLDPFMGTGTTALAGMFNGMRVLGIDANPFTHFVSGIKTGFDINIESVTDSFNRLKEKLNSLIEDKEYSWKNVPTTDIREHLKNIWTSRSSKIENNGSEISNIPPMPHLNRWMSPDVLEKVITLNSMIDNELGSNDNSCKVRNLFKLAFASILLPVSNVKLSGPKIAYRRRSGKRLLCLNAPVYSLFTSKVKSMIDDLAIFSGSSGLISPELHFGDSRKVANYIGNEGGVDIAISSPPYLNEVDYLDNTRLELYFLEFIKNDDELRELKNLQIRGNSKYLFSDNRDYPDRIPDIPSFKEVMKYCRKVEEKWKEKKYGWDHPRLVAEYFIDMTDHLTGMHRVIKERGKYTFIVGDSALDGIHIPTDNILAEIAKDLGFSDAIVTPFRRRGSSRHGVVLRESLISITK